MHSWNLSPADAIVLQQALRQQVCIEPLNKKIKYIAGGDVSLNMFEKDIYAGVIVLAEIDREWTLKILRKNKQRLYLEAANPKYPPFIPKHELKIYGVIKAVVRKFN